MKKDDSEQCIAFCVFNFFLVMGERALGSVSSSFLSLTVKAAHTHRQQVEVIAVFFAPILSVKLPLRFHPFLISILYVALVFNFHIYFNLIKIKVYSNILNDLRFSKIKNYTLC